MQIQDFHSKLTSGNEPCALFQALRNLSLVEDAQSMFDGNAIDVDWGSWPPGGGSEAAAVQA
jgi:hypothetical protein